MGLLAVSNIFLRSKFTAYDSGCISEALRLICNEVEETRKGRHWEVVYSREERSPFTIHVYQTSDYLWEVEEELAALGLTSEDAPEVVSVISAVGREIDKEACQIITDTISAIFNCVSAGAKLVS